MEVLRALGICIGALLILAGAVNTIGSAVEKIVRMRKAAKVPNDVQTAQIKELTGRVNKHDEFLANDKKKLDDFGSSTRVIQRALLALLEHGIDGNSIERMQNSRKELEDHLINR